MQRLLRDLFVDRSQHTSAFIKMLENQTPRRIMLLEAGAGMGKSWLLHVFAHEAKSRHLPLVHIDFADRQPYDTLMLVRRCRDAFGPEHFNQLTQVINDVTTPRVTLSSGGVASERPVNVSIGSENILTESTISVSNVGNIVFKDNFFSMRTDDPLMRQAIEDRINAVFFECLSTLCSTIGVIFLFDTYERNSLKPDEWVSRAADRWICGQLLARIREAKLEKGIVVLAGRRLPQFTAEWAEVLGTRSLDPFGCKDVIEYLRVRRGLGIITDIEAQRLYEAVAGNPQMLGLIGDNLEQAIQPAGIGDEW